MSPELILRDPDPIMLGRKRDKADTEWHALLAKAMKKPGRWWEVVPVYGSPGAASTAAYDINTGRNGGLPEGEWEACSRTRELDGVSVGVLFIKFVGK